MRATTEYYMCTYICMRNTKKEGEGRLIRALAINGITFSGGGEGTSRASVTLQDLIRTVP